MVGRQFRIAAALVVAGTLGITTAYAGSAAPSQAAARRRQVTAATVFARMTEAQRVGQLFMVGTPATSASPATLGQITRLHVGNVILTGRSTAGTRVPARVVATMQSRTTAAATSGVRLLVSTDQEGGAVQVLRGPGISNIPPALQQGRFRVARLRRLAGVWAGQLRACRVNMNLAPVLDVVPGPAAARNNPPIGVFRREYGFTPRRVASHGVAFAEGMADHGVAPTAKHFPGLGRVTANTDTSSGVTDTVTRRHDPFLLPFARAVQAGIPFVMVSLAIYARLDPSHPAAFSSFVIRTMLRGDLGFRGVVVSDDLGAAKQVAAVAPGSRAVRFLRAGGDVILTVTPAPVPGMYHAVLARARSNSRFRAVVNRAVMLVLRAKQAQGLLPAH